MEDGPNTDTRNSALAARRVRRAHLRQHRRVKLAVSRTIVGLLAGLLVAGGCTSLRQWWRQGAKVGPNYAPPAAPVAETWIDAGEPGITCDPVQDCAWWTVFDDPVLAGLIDAAYRQNLDLRAAGARILSARAQRSVAIGNLFPQSQTALAAYAHAQITHNLGLPIPGNFSLWADGFNASWELDFWGRFRRTIEASTADMNAATERYGETLVMLLSEVATRYVQLRTFEARLEFARRNVEIQRGSLKLAEARYRDGKATELDMRQARSNLAQTEALVPPLVIGRRQAANQLCILMGLPVNDLASQLPPAPIPQAPLELAVGIPADLLRRRPDVRRAEREAAAQCARIGVAEADLYPRLGVTGFLGYAANDLKDVFQSKSFTGFIVPTLQWNILNYGRVINNVRSQDAQFQAATLAYQQTVLVAGREFEDALIGFLQSQQQAARLEESVADAERSVELVTIQFEAGVTDFNRVFNTQATLVSLQDQWALARGNIALNLIQAYKALGGSWPHFRAGQGMPCAPAMRGEPAEPGPEIGPGEPISPPRPE